MTAMMDKNTVKRMILFWTFQKRAFFVGGFLSLALLMGFLGGRLPGLTGRPGLPGLTGSFPGTLTTSTEMLDIFKGKKDTLLAISSLEVKWNHSVERILMLKGLNIMSGKLFL